MILKVLQQWMGTYNLQKWIMQPLIEFYCLLAFKKYCKTEKNKKHLIAVLEAVIKGINLSSFLPIIPELLNSIIKLSFYKFKYSNDKE